MRVAVGDGPQLADDPEERSAARAGFVAMLSGATADDPIVVSPVARAATLGFLSRSDRAGRGGFARLWDAYVAAATAAVGEDDWGLTVGVMTNMIGLVDLADPEDLVMSGALVDNYGHRAVAAVQSTIDDRLGTGARMPLATRTVLALTATESIAATLEGAGSDRAAADDLAHQCFVIGFRLVMSGIGSARLGDKRTTPQGVAEVWDAGIAAWRSQIAIIADNPWTAYPVDLQRLALLADLPVLAAIIGEATHVYRDRSARRERAEVAREIRRLVAISGLSQRQFASMVGTSASRISTYSTGAVTPAATMMLRIRRFSKLAHDRAADQRTAFDERIDPTPAPAKPDTD